MVIDAVLVTYNCGDGFAQNLRNIASVVRTIYLFDNGSDERTKDAVRKIGLVLGNKLLSNLSDSNVGLGAAQNWGIEQSMLNGSDAVLLLDHDSVFTPIAIARYFEEVVRTLQNETVNAIFCPNIVDVHTGRSPKFVFLRRGRLIFAPMTRVNRSVVFLGMASGMVIPRTVLEKVGFMNEAFFIDSIDTEFCLRARRRGILIRGVPDVFLIHQLGMQSVVSLFGTKITLTNHSALRLRYIFRNKLWLLRQLSPLPTQFILFDIVNSLAHFLKVVFFEGQRQAKLKAIANGILHGLGPMRKR